MHHTEISLWCCRLASNAISLSKRSFPHSDSRLCEQICISTAFAFVIKLDLPLTSAACAWCYMYAALIITFQNLWTVSMIRGVFFDDSNLAALQSHWQVSNAFTPAFVNPTQVSSPITLLFTPARSWCCFLDLQLVHGVPGQLSTVTVAIASCLGCAAVKAGQYQPVLAHHRHVLLSAGACHASGGGGQVHTSGPAASQCRGSRAVGEAGPHCCRLLPCLPAGEPMLRERLVSVRPGHKTLSQKLC